MLANDQTLTEFTLPTVDVGSVARRVALPAFAAAAAAGAVFVVGGHVGAIATAVRRSLDVQAGWAALGIAFECFSLAGYVVLLSLVAGRATARIDARVSAQITLAGAAATRLLPTAGAGGAALALWTFRRAGLRSLMAARTLLAFMVLLYSVFLASIVGSGAALALGLTHTSGPAALSAIPAAAATVAIGLALIFAHRRRAAPAAGAADAVRAVGAVATGNAATSGQAEQASPGQASRLTRTAQMVGDAVLDACRLVRSHDVRILGAPIYWLCDAAVLWSMLHAFGASPAVPVVVIAYFVGQAANTLPIPGSVSGGIAGVLIAFGAPAAIAIPAVLAYRTVAVWLPTPVAVASVPSLRSTIARWGREDAAAASA
jgi:uncharacterized membrane protein YbhN (UPF0104 family)